MYNRELLDDPNEDNSYDDFWDKIKRMEDESLERIIEYQNERDKK